MNFKTTILVATLLIANLAMAEQERNGRPDFESNLSDTDKAALKACETSSSMPNRDSGTHPSETQMKAFADCLKAANIQMPPPPDHEHRGHHEGFGGGQAEQDNNQNQSAGGTAQ